MRYKLTALAVALAVLFAGIVMVDGNGSDAAPTSKEINIIQGDTQTFQLMTNERTYKDNAGLSSYTANWSLKNETGMTKDGITYAVTAVAGDANVGLYDVKMTASDTASASSASHILVFTVTLTVGTGTHDKEVLTYEYPLTVTTTSKPDAVTLTAMTATQNVPFIKTITVATGTFTVANYDWYAVGLPDGLGMAKDGTVSGLATKQATAKDYDVTAVEKTTSTTTTIPKTYFFKLNLTVNAETTTGTVYLTFTNAKVIGDATGSDKKITFSGIGGSGTGTVSPSDTAYVVQGATGVKFTVSTTGGSTVSVTKVVTISSSGTEQTVAGGATEYSLDASGTGSYKTMVYVNVDGKNAVLVFNLLVLENPHGDWAPAFVINGN